MNYLNAKISSLQPIYLPLFTQNCSIQIVFPVPLEPMLSHTCPAELRENKHNDVIILLIFFIGWQKKGRNTTDNEGAISR
jgi:hypothetical protein